MNKQIPVYQLILTLASLLIVMIASWVNISTRITALEISQVNSDRFIHEIRDSFKELNDGQTKIMIQLENKKNRE